jgi:putative ABC transport system permease protein
MKALDRKLLRDLVRLWAQSLAVALVMACGVATLVLSLGSWRSLEETRAAYYERYRFGHVFASAVRAPNSLLEQIAAINGVASAEARITEAFLLDIEGMREPASGTAVSLPPGNDPAVNALYLRDGRLPEVTRANEVAVNADFADAHGFNVGSRFVGQFGSARVALTIVGIVLSPEYVYAIGPGDMMPDNRRFGVVWMPEETLAALYDLDGAFNSVSLILLPGTNPVAVIDEVDRLLEPYGGIGAVERKDQLSNAFIESELTQLRGMAAFIPPVCLLVSAFLINMILSRLIALEREQIGLLKALGYGRAEVVWHYLKLVLVIAAAGILIGSVAGTLLGRGMTVMYARFYSFPFLIFRSDPDMYLIAAGVTVAAAVLGAFQASRSVFNLPPAVAMHPPAPAAYRRLFDGAFERMRLFSHLPTMAIRHLIRHPVRAGLTAVGVSFAVGLIAMGLGTLSSIDSMIDAVFFRADRQDATIVFSTARPESVMASVRRLPGVLAAEPYHALPARISNGHLSRQLSITGKPPASDLSRVLDLDLEPVVLPESGLALGDRVAALLDVGVGDLVRVEFLTDARREVEVPVTQVIQSYLGLMVFAEIEALARMAGTGPRVIGAHLAVDPARLDALYAAVKETPEVAAIALQTIARERFQETMQENIVLMLGVFLTLSVIIAFGVVYNSARIQLSERARELATLRVLGFGRGEVSRVLFIETGVIVAVAQPLGWALGVLIGYVVINGLATDLFRVPVVFAPSSFAIASLVVVGAALVSALMVRRRVDRLDLVRVLKTRE